MRKWHGLIKLSQLIIMLGGMFMLNMSYDPLTSVKFTVFDGINALT